MACRLRGIGTTTGWWRRSARTVFKPHHRSDVAARRCTDCSRESLEMRELLPAPGGASSTGNCRRAGSGGCEAGVRHDSAAGSAAYGGSDEPSGRNWAGDGEGDGCGGAGRAARGEAAAMPCSWEVRPAPSAGTTVTERIRDDAADGGASCSERVAGRLDAVVDGAAGLPRDTCDPAAVGGVAVANAPGPGDADAVWLGDAVGVGTSDCMRGNARSVRRAGGANKW